MAATSAHQFRIVILDKDGRECQGFTVPIFLKLKLIICSLLGHNPILAGQGHMSGYTRNVGPLIPYDNVINIPAQEGYRLYLQQIEEVGEPTEGRIICKRCHQMNWD